MQIAVHTLSLSSWCLQSEAVQVCETMRELRSGTHQWAASFAEEKIYFGKCSVIVCSDHAYTVLKSAEALHLTVQAAVPEVQAAVLRYQQSHSMNQTWYSLHRCEVQLTVAGTE